jgi:eukaryotic-like serine/threonine-protein kinase
MQLEPGAMITDKVRLERPLREGGMGVVWAAHHVGLDVPVAVKFVLDELVERDASVVDRFVFEAKTAARIKSPHVVKVFDQGATPEGVPYLVMELLEGNSLSEWLSLVKRMSLRDTARVVSQVASVLDKAHAAGIVHRDIKPDNVFLVEGERELFVKVLDFGVAKLTRGGGQQVTTAGMAIGTPAYMSPEQVLREGQVTFRADLWALAVTAYEMLTGEVPFMRDDLRALALAICAGEFTPVTKRLPAGAPTELDAWFACALHRDPEERFASAEAMARALENIIEDAAAGTGRFAPLAPTQQVAKLAPEEAPAPKPAYDGALPELELDLPKPVAPARAPETARKAVPAPAPVRPAAPVSARAPASAPASSIRVATTARGAISDRGARSPARIVATGRADHSESRASEARLAAGGLRGAAVVIAALFLARLSGAPGRALLATLGSLGWIVAAAAAAASAWAALRLLERNLRFLGLAALGAALLGGSLAAGALSMLAPSLGLAQFDALFSVVGHAGAGAVAVAFGLLAASLARDARARGDTPRALALAVAALFALAAAAAVSLPKTDATRQTTPH